MEGNTYEMSYCSVPKSLTMNWLVALLYVLSAKLKCIITLHVSIHQLAHLFKNIGIWNFKERFFISQFLGFWDRLRELRVLLTGMSCNESIKG